ncbi:hypothetical protein CJ197_06980 [Brachybacterium sp. UMB0905]|nr:hypothetical protein CJ197_06980 [Brachybacterium sp. UMB0905]
MANPIVTIAVPIAGFIAARLGSQAASAGWGAVFGEEAPTPKKQKAAEKAAAQRRKELKKEGASKAEISAVRNPEDETPVWKIVLWTTISGLVLQGLRVAAQRGTKAGLERAMSRRPRSNRG